MFYIYIVPNGFSVYSHVKFFKDFQNSEYQKKWKGLAESVVLSGVQKI
jgi:hypothetical protein